MRPILRSEAATADVNGVITIRNLNQLQLMGANLSGSYRLAGNIDASASAGSNAAGIFGSGGFVPVGMDATRFTGSLNGAGYVINGLTINRPSTDAVGLIGYAGTGSSISNLGLVGGTVTGSISVGGLVGISAGTITQSYTTGAVTGRNYVGGLVGANTGNITQAYATGAVTGSNYVGGLVGANAGTIAQSYATGAVTGSGDYVGGLVGYNNGTITQSYWDTQTTGQATGDGGTGLTTAQMQDITSFRTTYDGWDFANIWSPPNQIGQNNGSTTAYYPQLYSLSPAVAASTSLSFSRREYGDSDPTASISYAGLRSGDTIATGASLTGLPGLTADVGSYQVSGSGAVVSAPSGAVYRMIYVPVALSVSPRLITVTPNAGQSRQYGDPNPTLTYALSRTTTGASGAALVGTDSLTGALASAATGTSNVGSHAINQGTLAGSSNYTLSFTSGRTMAVTPRLITVRADDLARDYGQPNPALTYRISSGSLVTGDGFGGSLFTNAGSESEAGSYAISQGSLALSTNYAMTLVPGTLTISAGQVPSLETASQIARSFDHGMFGKSDNRVFRNSGPDLMSGEPQTLLNLSDPNAVNIPQFSVNSPGGGR
jgi:hypothetical protein